MSEGIKLTDEEISSIKSLRENVINVISTIGQLKLTSDLLKDELEAVEIKIKEQVGNYKNLNEEEKKLINGLLEKYGVGSLDVDTGVFTPEK
jgi:hypothetical protein